MLLGNAVPVLRIFDQAMALDFYVGYLGFRVDWEHRFSEGLPVYLQVSRDRCVLHLSEHFGDGTPGTAVYVELTGLAELHAELRARPYRHANPGLEAAEWGGKTMTLTDPFGNRLTFSEPEPRSG